MHDIASLSRRQSKLVSRLAKFDVVAVIEILAALLISPDSHPATLRIESMIHLAACHCQGVQKPTLSQIRDWLNNILLRDPIGGGEDPVEDVFTSVVPSWTGGVTLFEGAFRDNAFYLQHVMSALLRLRAAEPWADRAFEHVMLLLRLAGAMSERSKAPRYIVSTKGPRQPVTVAENTVQQGIAAVQFSLQDIFALGLKASDIAPFVVSQIDVSSLSFGTLGNTDFERRPILRHADGWLICLPTAIGAAARRYVLELASAAGALDQFQQTLRDIEVHETATLTSRNWVLEQLSDPTYLGHGLTAFTAKFDEGAFAVIVNVSDDLAQFHADGLNGTKSFQAADANAIADLENDLASRADYRRGLTIVALGGVGRGCAIGFRQPPANWHRVDLPLGDGLRMVWDGDFKPHRLWKTQHHQDQLQERGYNIVSTEGFLNLYAYLEARKFDLVPSGMTSPCMIMLTADHVVNLRERVRQSLDYHLTLSSSGQRLVEVQRRSTASYFKEISRLPLFVAAGDAINGDYLAVVETNTRPWWVETILVGPNRKFYLGIWDAAQRWMVRLAPILEERIPSLPHGPVCVKLIFPGIANLEDELATSPHTSSRPTVSVRNNVICIESDLAALKTYVDSTNIAERYLVAAIALGACQLANDLHSTEWADEIAAEILGTTDARFVHAIPATDIVDMIQAAIQLPAPRFASVEDRTWSHFGLAAIAGHPSAGEVTKKDTGPLLQAAVLQLWNRIKGKLEHFDRRDLVSRVLHNQESIDQDRADWRRTAAAQLALHSDKEDVLRVHNEIEEQRALSAVAGRAIAEMAICTCPLSGGKPSSDIDFDDLLADVATMLDCAGQCDAHFHDLAQTPLAVTASHSFEFDADFAELLHIPYMRAHGDRAFRDAAAEYAGAFQSDAAPNTRTEPQLDPVLQAAVLAEFGLDFRQLVDLSYSIGEIALEKNCPLVAMPKSEFLALLSSLGPTVDAEHAFRALTLVPRPIWNSPTSGAGTKDWMPWRMNRKLSLTRRPFLQIDESEDPEIIAAPVLVSRTLRRYFELIDGHIGSEMFDTKEIGSWVGTLVDKLGHEFNHKVAAKLKGLGLETIPDKLMTSLGGTQKMGDIDVLAWNPASGVVWAIECKRLQLDRTVAEIGERLAEYTTLAEPGKKRTPIQKHLDRLQFIRVNRGKLAQATGIPENNQIIRSALVTSGIVPMQFSKKMVTLVDKTCDYRNIDQTSWL